MRVDFISSLLGVDADRDLRMYLPTVTINKKRGDKAEVSPRDYFLSRRVPMSVPDSVHALVCPL